MTATLPSPVTDACKVCPLGRYWKDRGQWHPCPSEINSNADTIIVGPGPRKQDVAAGRAWTDNYGAEVVETLSKLGVKRTEVSWANVVACRWPNDYEKGFMAGLKRRNRYRKRKGEAPHPTPMKCCEKRLQEDIALHSNIVPMGPLATKALLPGNPTFSSVRGGPTETGDDTKVLPTFHPEQVQFQPKFKPVFKSDLAKAFRFFKDRLRWADPKITWTPTALELQAKLAAFVRQKQVVWYDVEAVKDPDDEWDALTDDLRCIGLGNELDVVMVHFLSVDGVTRFYNESDEADVKRVLANFFVYPHITKGGQNAGYYDRMVIEQHLGVTPAPLVDTILLHHLAESEYPHGLGFIGSLHTDVPAWKAEHTAVTAQTDRELGAYCATDVAVTARVAKPLMQKMVSRSQRPLYKTSAQLQELCVGMHRMGIRIDEGRRLAHEEEQTEIKERWATAIAKFRPGMNPNSHDQVRKLIFKDWALPPHQYTDGGEPSTNAASLIHLLGNPLVEAEQRVFLNALRRYRKAEKLLGTYITKFPGITRDGYIHPDWNTTGTVSGRLSASKFQTIPWFLRDMFIPPPGCVFIEADYDQLELRLGAALSGATYYLDAFNDKVIDPHSLTAQLMFGDTIWQTGGAPKDKMLKGEGAFKKIRDGAKTLCFLSLYGGGAPMAHEQMVATEDGAGNLPYSHYTLRDVRALQRRWLRNVPELKVWWEQCLTHWRKTGYIEEPVMGRRRYFHEEDYNAIPNFQVQSGGFAIVAGRMIKLARKIPFDFSAKTGLVNQLHDAVLFSVPEARAEEMQALVEGTLTTEALGMKFTVDAGICEHWGQK